MSPWRYLNPYRWTVGFGGVMLVATNALSLAEPVLLGKIVDALNGDDPASTVPTLALLMVGFAVVTALTRIASRVALFNSARDAEYDLRGALFGKLLRMEPAYFREHSVGDVMSRLLNDVQTVRAMWGPGILNIVNTAVVFSTVLTMMLLIDPWLTLLAILPYPSMVGFGRLFGRRLYRSSRAVQVQLGELSSSIQEDLSGIGIIKTYALERQRASRFRTLSQALLSRNMDLTVIRGQLVPMFSGLASLSMVIVLWFGGKAVVQDEITLGEFVEFTSYLAKLVWPTLALGWMLSLFQRGMASWSRLVDILTRTPAVTDGAGPDMDGEAIRGDLELRDLTIAIDGETILDRVSLAMPAGTVTAIVGRTGSGKSTLVEAIPRLIDVPPGSVFLDGRDITELPLSTLRNAIGYAPQEAFLFSTTVARNIAFGYQRGRDEGAEPSGP
ncbi:MAG: ABC transporter transmembrane domain-containing protein, partial [Myxococcota bacterium]